MAHVAGGRYSAYVRAYLKKADAEERERQQRVTEALKLVQNAAEVLKQQFKAEAVYLFGSLLKEGRYRPDSDVDLAVAGIEPTMFFKAWAAAEKASGLPIDLIDLDTAPASLRNRISYEGRRLQ